MLTGPQVPKVKSITEFVSALKQCSKSRDLERGKSLHSDILSAGLQTDKYIATALVNLYSKCGCMPIARELFHKIPRPDVVSWTSLIMGYVENRQSSTALELFTNINCQPNYVTFVAGLKACGTLALERGSRKQVILQKVMDIHRQAEDFGLVNSNLFLGCALIDAYCKCDDVIHARRIFEKLPYKDAACWTSLILGYVENGESAVALELFSQMDVKPDSFTFSAVLKACAVLAVEKPSMKDVCLETGTSVHVRLGSPGSDVVVATSLIEMYSKCSVIHLAREVFNQMKRRNVVTWNSLILGYVDNGEYDSALKLFYKMDCQPDSVTYIGALKACKGLAGEKESEIPASLETGKAIHDQVRACGLESNVVVASVLVDMYSRCRCTSSAKDVFDKMCHRDIVAWNSLMLGYVENGEMAPAVELYKSMDIEPDSVTFMAVLKASCGVSNSLGNEIHARICRLGLDQDQALTNCLVDFYGKCGDMTAAEEAFNGMARRNIVSWTALLAGYTRLGDMSRVFTLVKHIEEVGLQLNEVTFLCILTACNHAGLVDEAREYFESMGRHGVRRRAEHYSCMVDILGRANRVDEAVSVIQDMPFQVDHVTWTSLLGSCRKWNDAEAGRFAFDALECGDSREASTFQLMSDIYKSKM